MGSQSAPGPGPAPLRAPPRLVIAVGNHRL